MINGIPELVRRGFIDFIRVHHGGDDIALSVLAAGVPIRFLIKPFCVFITAVRFKIHGVDVEHDLVKKHRVSFQSSAGNLSGFFHCEKNIHI